MLRYLVAVWYMTLQLHIITLELNAGLINDGTPKSRHPLTSPIHEATIGGGGHSLSIECLVTKRSHLEAAGVRADDRTRPLRTDTGKFLKNLVRARRPGS